MASQNLEHRVAGATQTSNIRLTSIAPTFGQIIAYLMLHFTHVMVLNSHMI